MELLQSPARGWRAFHKVTCMNQQQYFNTQQAAQRYGLSESWLTKLRVYGGGPSYIRCGRRVLYDATTFEAWLESQRRNNTSEG